MRKNKYGHIIGGKVTIKRLWEARDIIVSASNDVGLMLLFGVRKGKHRNRLLKLQKKLNKGMRDVNKHLGIPK